MNVREDVSDELLLFGARFELLRTVSVYSVLKSGK
jgi:hypothetical protein